MQISARVCRNGIALSISGFVMAAVVSSFASRKIYNPLISSALASESSLGIAQTTANELLAETDGWLNEGWHQMKSGQYQAAIASYESAIASSRNIGSQQQEAEALMGIGVVYTLLGNHQQSISFHGQALSIYQALDSSKKAAAALQGIADSYWAMGNYPQAESHFRQAIGIYQDIGDSQSEQYVLNLLDQVIAGQ